MFLIGLTGGIASGKSTVSEIFNKSHSVPIVDADSIARKGKILRFIVFTIIRYFLLELMLLSCRKELNRLETCNQTIRKRNFKLRSIN